jgi:tRNA (guanine37-N1)-methyltransferase
VRIDILSLFPEYFQGPFDVSIVRRARERGIIDVRLTDIRDFAEGKHSKVDDRPYGGGPGMVLMPEPVCKAIRSVKSEEAHVVYLTPQGSVLNAKKCEELATKKHLILLAGHYEGVDERVLQKEVNEEISIGDYVLTNGCVAAIVVVDAVIRFIPGVLGHEEAAASDSFQNGIFDAPHYTRPEMFEGMEVPEVLKNGNHAEIAKWRHAQAVVKTRRVRPEFKIGERQ